MSDRFRTISRNFGVMSVGSLAGRVLSFVTVIYLTRVLGVESYGVIVFATAALAYAEMAVDCGFDGLGPREIARGIIPIRDFVGAALTMRLVMTMIAFGGMALVAWLGPIGPSAAIVILLYGCTLLANAIDLSYVFLGTDQMRIAAFAEVASSLFTTIGVISLVRGPEQVALVPILFLAARLFAVFGLIAAYTVRYGAPLPRVNLPLLKGMIRSSLPMNLSGWVGLLNQNFDILLLTLWVSSAVVGIYGAAYRVVWIPTMITVAYFTAMRPAICRAYVNGYHTIASLMERSQRLISAAAIGVLVTGTMLAEPLVSLFYGPKYSGAVSALRILLFCTAFFMLGRNHRAVLLNFEHQWVMLWVTIGAAIVNVTLNLLLISRYGLVGAALSAAASQAIFFVGVVHLTGRLVEPLPVIRHLWRPLIGSIGLALVLWLTQSLHIAFRLFLGGSVYMALLAILGVFSASEISAFVRVWRPAQRAKVAAA